MWILKLFNKMTNHSHESKVQKYPSDLYLVEMPVKMKNNEFSKLIKINLFIKKQINVLLKKML